VNYHDIHGIAKPLRITTVFADVPVVQVLSPLSTARYSQVNAVVSAYSALFIHLVLYAYSAHSALFVGSAAPQSPWWRAIKPFHAS